MAAGKGTRFPPSSRKLTPDAAEHYGIFASDYNARMFGSFLDSTKHAIEMTVLSNATGLDFIGHEMLLIVVRTLTVGQKFGAPVTKTSDIVAAA